MQNDNRSNFNKPGVYQIKVEGNIDQKWSESLGGMQIKINKQNNKVFSVLTGEISDQAALNGILNGLYDMRYSVMSVACLELKKIKE